MKYTLLIFFVFLFLIRGFETIADAKQKEDPPNDICAYLGTRSDKNFLGSGNLAVIIDSEKTNIGFVQQWKYGGICDWMSGTIKSWNPDQIELKDPNPAHDLYLSKLPDSRRIFITKDDIIGMELRWTNRSKKKISIQSTCKGKLPGVAIEDEGVIKSNATYSDKLPDKVFYEIVSNQPSAEINLDSGHYRITNILSLEPGETKSLTIFFAIGLNENTVRAAVKKWRNSPDPILENRIEWNEWFAKAIPEFDCSDVYFKKLYYYRWWSLYTKMIFAKIGHFYYPAPREGTVAYDGVVSYSGSCISVDELKWMRNPDWALSTTKEFFAPENLNDGYLSNHIWDWGIDGDESNMDKMGRSIPYQNYAIDAYYGIMLVHPDETLKTLSGLWPELVSNLESYQRIFDIDKDGLYETYPWSNSAGQEWTARYSYFDPIPEMFRNERGRTYTPDGTNGKADMELMQKIKTALVTNPSIHWPENADELYRVYYANEDHRLATVDQSCYAYKNFKAAATLARMMHDSVHENKYSRLGEKTSSGILKWMWDEKDNFFYDVKPVSLQKASVKSVTGYYVFWAKITDKKHAGMFRHLFDNKCFWTKYPLPSLPLDYEKYDALQETGWTYWNYATWPRTTCHAVDAALWAAKNIDFGLQPKAVELLKRYTHMHFLNDDPNLINIAERYDPHTGKPFMPELDYNHSTWIDLVMQHVVGITLTDKNKLLIDPIDMGWNSFSMKNIRYRNHDVDVLYDKSSGLTVLVDGQIKLQHHKFEKIEIAL